MAKKNDNTQPWDRIENEPSRWYDRFWRYLLLGPTRSVEKVYREENGLSEERWENARCDGSWHNAAREWRWAERADQYDEEQRRQHLTENAVALQQARERHLKIGTGLMQRAMRAIEAINPSDLTPREAIAWLEFGVELERAGLEGTQMDGLGERLAAIEKKAKQITRNARRRRRKRDSDAL